MDVFGLRDSIISDYSSYIRSFFYIADDRIRQKVEEEMEEGLLWPQPLLQLNPAFEWGGWIDSLVDDGTLHQTCARIFRAGKSETDHQGKPMRLYRHQVEAIRAAGTGENYVLTTGTGSGKSLAYIVPIVNAVLRGKKKRWQQIGQIDQGYHRLSHECPGQFAGAGAEKVPRVRIWLSSASDLSPLHRAGKRGKQKEDHY